MLSYSPLVCVLLLAVTIELSHAEADFYTAAVYEHAVAYREASANVTNRETALAVMRANLAILEQQVIKAKSQVTP